jgi:hypothetical protein
MTDPISRRDAKGEPSDDDMLRRGDVKATLFPLWDRVTGEPVCELAAALDKLSALDADGRKKLDPDEVKAVLAEALSSQPMAKVWAEAAINAMVGQFVSAPPAAERRPAVDDCERCKKLEALLQSAIERMDRARNILTDGKPSWSCNWGILDTSDLTSGDAAQPGE